MKLPSWVTDFIPAESFTASETFLYHRTLADLEKKSLVEPLQNFKANLVMLGCRISGRMHDELGLWHYWDHDAIPNLGWVLRETPSVITVDTSAFRVLLNKLQVCSGGEQ